MNGRVDLPDGHVAFAAWSHALCVTCGDEFEVTRTEPRTFPDEDAVQCDTCRAYARGVADGAAAMLVTVDTGLLLDEVCRRIEGRP